MRKVYTILGLVVALGLTGATANCNLDPNVATANQAVIAINTYNAAVATGTNYLRLPLCPTAAPVCRTQALSQSVYSALKSGRAARTQLITALAADQSAPITAIQALEAAYSVIQSIPTH
jgi:hypothetical protein